MRVELEGVEEWEFRVGVERRSGVEWRGESESGSESHGELRVELERVEERRGERSWM